MGEIFRHLLVLGRPAGGKSEFIDFMQRQPDDLRSQRYHLGPLRVVDDFPILWDYCLDDDLRERHGQPRLYSRRADPAGYATSAPIIWPLLVDRINRIVRSECLEHPGFYEQHTVLIEFSRGREQGYREALGQIDHEILSHGAVLYIAVSFEESWRRNLARYDETRQSGILTHIVPFEAMQRVYSADDWLDMAPDPAGWLTCGGVQLPYVVMDNEDESTDPAVLDGRYGAALNQLWALTKAR